MLVASPQTPIEQPRAGAGCAFLRNALCRAEGTPGRGKRSALFLLAVCLLLLLLIVVAHQAVHIGLDGQQLLHIVTRLTVVRVCRLASLLAGCVALAGFSGCHASSAATSSEPATISASSAPQDSASPTTQIPQTGEAGAYVQDDMTELMPQTYAHFTDLRLYGKPGRSHQVFKRIQNAIGPAFFSALRPALIHTLGKSFFQNAFTQITHD